MSALVCFVKNVASAESAIFCACEENKNNSAAWKSTSGNAPDELAARRAFRDRAGSFQANKKRGYWAVIFTPNKPNK